jgi:hypothetical protein
MLSTTRIDEMTKLASVKENNLRNKLRAFEAWERKVEMANIPYSFLAKMADGRTISHGDKPALICATASNREIEQTVLERAEQYGEVLSVTWARMSDYSL